MTSKSKPFLMLGVMGAVGICFTTGCGEQTLAGKWEYKEVNRIKSPDSLVDALVIEGDAGATTSTATSVYLVPVGGSVDPEDRLRSLFTADHLKNFAIEWKEPKLLEIRYDEGRIFGFMNFWSSREVQQFHYVVEIKLAPTRSGFSLPLKDRTW
jgi:hypothetical protein